ncbi:hypothetical protein [Sphingomonas daechungensis]|uniref:hypothetical protein n=1 Tax=Sphingomonas daechungensis TaxID=1176646 RepID=UPI001CB9C754|nr:hypothetical protein [Sphingomonas daechungensis]
MTMWVMPDAKSAKYQAISAAGNQLSEGAPANHRFKAMLSSIATITGQGARFIIFQGR